MSGINFHSSISHPAKFKVNTGNSYPTDEVSIVSNTAYSKPSNPPVKSFRKLFTHSEILHYTIAGAVYITLGILFQGTVLNWIVGPLFIVGWMWLVPPLVEKLKPRLSQKWRPRQS